MLSDAAEIRQVVLCTGYIDLRKGIDGFALIIGSQFEQNSFEKGTLFLFVRKHFKSIVDYAVARILKSLN